MTFRPRVYTAALALALATFTVLPMHADDASKRRHIEDMFALLQMDKTIEQISAQQVTTAKQLMTTMIPAGSMTPDMQQDLDAFLAKVVAITHDAVNWSKLEPQFVDLYASTYSEEEIDGLLAFYRSPTGQSLIAKQPELLSKSQAISQAQLVAIQPKLREAVVQFAQEMMTKRSK